MPRRTASPYPYARWPKLRRSEAAVASALARIALHAEGSHAARMIEAVAGALGAAELSVTACPARLMGPDELAAIDEPLAAVELALRDDGVDRTLVLELSAELAGALVDRALGGDGGVRAAGVGLDDLELGALGYLAARACAASAGRLRVRGVTASRSRVLELLGTGAEAALAWPLVLRAGEASGSARVLLSPAAIGALAQRRSPARGFDVPSGWLGLPITLCAHAATVRLTVTELGSLAPGDLLLPERTGLSFGARGWYGEVALHVHGRVHGAHARCDLSERALRIAAFDGGELAMSDQDDPQALVKDAPIELCVELARFTVRLDEVLGLRVGEVLETGRAIGERVLITANGRAIARGELVDIEGDIGVRILEKHE
jgi:type III secretion protein Q